MKKTLILGLMLVSLLNITAYAKQRPTEQSLDQVAAIVNDDIVTSSELNKSLKTAKAQIAQQGMPNPTDKVLEKQVLDKLINKKLQMQIAKLAGVQVKDADVDNAVGNIAKQNNMSPNELYARVTEEGGMTKDEYRAEIHDQMTLQRLQQMEVASRISVSKDEIDNFTRSRAWKKNGAKEYHLEDILIPISEAPTTEEITEAYKRADGVVAKLKQGQSFQQVAQSESGGANALQGGDLGWRKLPEIPGGFGEQVSHMEPKQIAGPIQTPNGFHIIRLVDTRNGGLDSNPTRKQIEDLLLNQKFEEAVQNWVSKLRSQAFIVTNLSGK